jgi:hypothetical protein
LTHARLNGSRVVGVDSTGTIAIVVGVQGAPSPLWGDLLVDLEGRPIVITHLKPRAPDRSPAEPPTQIELRVRSSNDIREALDWLADAIDQTNTHHDAHQHRLAAIYREALACVDDWYENTGTSGSARQVQP